MKQENYRTKKKINRMTTALLGIFFYILIVLMLKTVQNWIPVGSMGMKIFGVVEFIVATLYLVLYTWYNFKDASSETIKTFFRYLLIIMIPLTVMTLVTILVIMIGTKGTFSSIWNWVTFFIAPTIFCYIPYGIVYEGILSTLPVSVYFVLSLIYMGLAQYFGYILGSRSRKFAIEREQKRIEQSKLVMQRQDEMARRAYAAKRRAAAQAAKIDEHDPLKDIENTPVIETEAFSMVTDEMIEDAVRRKKIKSVQEKAEQRRARNEKISERYHDLQIKEKEEIEEIIEAPVYSAEKKEKMSQPSEEGNKKSLADSLDRELAFIRKKMEEKKENK